MQIIFHNNIVLILTKGSETRNFNVEKNVMYKLKKYRKDNLEHYFLFDFHGDIWRANYNKEDFEIFYQGGVEVQQDESVDSFNTLQTVGNNKTLSQPPKNIQGKIINDVKPIQVPNQNNKQGKK